MNKFLSIVVPGIVGAAIGSGITWYFTNKYWVEKNAKQLEVYREYFDKRLDNLESNNCEPKKSAVEPETKTCEPKSSENEPISYHSIIKDNYNFDAIDMSEDDEEELEELAEKQKEREEENKPKDKPYLIHMDAYTGDDDIHYQSSYAHVTLDYYSGDDKVASALNNELIEPPERILGYDWRLHFGDEEYGSDENCVYVRNDERQVDYEIVRTNGYYCEIILGIDPPTDEE